MAVPRVERRLAAVLAADIVGYSRLVERDEAATLAAIRALREQVIDPLLAEHQGRIVKLMGDGAIAEFGSVVDAVACAVAIQTAIGEHQAGVAADRRIVFRIGINLGDVVVEGDDLLGDGVNVAARLEQLCEPGGVLVSGTAFDHLQGKLGLPLEFRGEQRIKNIERPVRAYRVRLDGWTARRPWVPVRLRRYMSAAAAIAALLIVAGATGWWLAHRSADSPLPDEPSIAVLPFENRTGDERIGRLADGMVGDIIGSLSRAGMFVIGRGTSFAYLNRPHDARTLGRDLGVRFVLEGGLDGNGQRLRATVGLVDTASGAEVWSERYDRPLDDLFLVQDELTQRIVDSVGSAGGAIRRAQTEFARAKPADSLQAFDFMLLGRAALFRHTPEDNAEALDLLRRAVALDPSLARAYMNLAGVYEQQVRNGWAPHDQAMAAWKAAARTAVELAPENAWSRHMQALWYMRAGQPAAFAAEVQRAAELVEDSQLMFLIAELLPLIGQSDRGAELARRGLRLDPAAIDRYRYVVQQTAFFSRRFAEAAAASEALVEPDEVDALYAALAYAQLGRAADLERWRARVLDGEPEFSGEELRWQEGSFVLPQADAELALWQDSLAKARLPPCAAPERIATLGMTPLPECEAERARLSPSR